MVINFQDYAKANKPNLLQPWYDSSVRWKTPFIANIGTAGRYMTKAQAAAADKEEERRNHNTNVLNHFGIFK